MQAQPIHKPIVGVLYSDPLRGDRARSLFEGVMYTRLKRLASTPASYFRAWRKKRRSLTISNTCYARDRMSSCWLRRQLLRGHQTRSGAMSQVGCSIESFLASVELGNLLLLSYMQEVPVVAAPGCFRSTKPNGIDLILSPLLAECRLSAGEISTLGYDGLLQ